MEGTEVRNLAMPGFGVDQIWMSLRHWGLPLKPDLVIVGLFAEDFGRCFHAYRSPEGFNKPTFALKGGGLVPKTYEDRPHWLLRFVERRSHLFSLMRHVDEWMGYQYRVGAFWSFSEALMEEIREEGRKNDIPLLFVLIPYKNDQPSIAPFAAYLAENGFDYVDDLRKIPTEERVKYYFENDGHLNAEGHALLADLLLHRIKESMTAAAPAERAHTRVLSGSGG